MYKRQSRTQVLYFKYAPPLSRWDRISKFELPNSPFEGAKSYQRSVFYYWWLFLKEHDGYMACCEREGKGRYYKLYQDFGDIRGDDFKLWWKEHGRYLFCEPPLEPVQVCKPNDDIFDEQDRVTLSVPLIGNFNRIMEDVKSVLMQQQKDYIGKIGSTAFMALEEAKQPRYPVFAKPVLTSLHQQHEVWRYRKTHPEMKNYEIADAIGIGVDETSDKGTDPKQQKSMYVSRNLKQARCLIEHVGKGLFPVTNPQQLEKKKLV